MSLALAAESGVPRTPMRRHAGVTGSAPPVPAPPPVPSVPAPPPVALPPVALPPVALPPFIRTTRFLLGGGVVFWLGTLVLSILTGAQAVYGVGIIVFGATVVAVWIFATVGKVDSCPRCGGPLVEPWHKQGASCATCGVSVGSLPTAEDLNDDEAGPG